MPPSPSQGGEGVATIWEEVSRTKVRTEGMATLNHALLVGFPLCWRVFGMRAHFSSSLPLLVFVKNVSLITPPRTQYGLGGITL